MIQKYSIINAALVLLIRISSIAEIATAYRECSFVLVATPRTGCNHRLRITPHYDTNGFCLSKKTQLWAEEEETSELPTGFNPFKAQQQQSSSSGSSAFAPGSVINLRKIRMSSITSALIQKRTVEEMKESLFEHKDFLLEPLEDDNAVLDEDSIYTPGMTRDERYKTYRKSMEERLQQARDPTAKKVLLALIEFTLSYE